jgi:hypothetical protein
MQCDSVGQDTPAREPPCAPGGFGVGVIDQVEPFQDSESVCETDPAEMLDPTATHAEFAAHDTADSAALSAPLGFGVGVIDQVEPSQDSASAAVTDWLLVDDPTARQDEALLQDTALRTVNVAPAGRGLPTTRQDQPFQDSMSPHVVEVLSL